MSIFKKNNTNKITTAGLISISSLSEKELLDRKKKFKPMIYPTKVLFAWGEAIKGNEKIRHWLMQNNYKELGIFCFALRNDMEAQQWLLKNGYPHLLALIKGIEDDEDALKWLKTFNYENLFNIANAARGDTDSKKWLVQHDKVYTGLSFKMKQVKDAIAYSNDDIHTINP